MKVEIDKEKLKEKRMAIKEDAYYAEIELENIKWHFSRSFSEIAMLNKARYDYVHQVSGLSKEEYDRCNNISLKYKELEAFYNETHIQRIKEYAAKGPQYVELIEYDYNLPIEEAYKKYAPVDREEATRIYQFMRDVEKKGILYEAGLRKNYTGDLAAQLGYNKDDFDIRKQWAPYTPSQEAETTASIDKEGEGKNL